MEELKEAQVDCRNVRLGPRQHAVLQLVVEGLTNDQIGQRLGTSAQTAKNHIAVIYKKLGARNRAHATRLVLEFGLLDRPPLEIPPAQQRTRREPRGLLTKRQRDVLELLTQGLEQPQIAQRLGVAPSTVKEHVRALYSKLGVHNRLRASERALELGLVDLRAGA